MPQRPGVFASPTNSPTNSPTRREKTGGSNGSGKDEKPRGRTRTRVPLTAAGVQTGTNATPPNPGTNQARRLSHGATLVRAVTLKRPSSGNQSKSPTSSPGKISPNGANSSRSPTATSGRNSSPLTKSISSFRNSASLSPPSTRSPSSNSSSASSRTITMKSGKGLSSRGSSFGSISSGKGSLSPS